MGGTVVTIGGLAWQVALWKWPGLTLPALQPWMVTTLGVGLLFMSTYRVWRDERQKALTLATTRPQFKPHYAGIEQVKGPDGRLKNRYIIRFRFDNPSGITAENFHRRVVATTDLNASPISDASQTMGNSVFDVVNIKSEISFPMQPPMEHYFVVFIKYNDGRTGAAYEQAFYYYWPGVVNGEFDFPFRDCSLHQRQLLDTYIANWT